MSRCRSCDAEIVWAVTDSGKRIPVDAEPVDGGNVLLSDRGVQAGPRTPLATAVGKRVQPSLFGDDSLRYTSHFATCPHADTHRRTRHAR
jgi:hypothetical protein